MNAQAHIATNTASGRTSAKPLLTEAVGMSPNYQPAILFLVTMLVEEGETLAALTMLKRMANTRPSPDIHTKIGDLHMQRNEREEAMKCYTAAIQ